MLVKIFSNKRSTDFSYVFFKRLNFLQQKLINWRCMWTFILRTRIPDITTSILWFLSLSLIEINPLRKANMHLKYFYIPAYTISVQLCVCKRERERLVSLLNANYFEWPLPHHKWTITFKKRKKKIFFFFKCQFKY